MAFHWRYNLYGGKPLIQTFLFDDTETLTVGDLVTLTDGTGTIDLAATGDVDLLGLFVGPDDPNDATDGQPGVVAGTADTTVGRVIVSPDAVYGVTDNNARLAGVGLDIAGTTGAQTVAADTNADFITIGRKRQNSDETHVMIRPAVHAYLTDPSP